MKSGGGSGGRRRRIGEESTILCVCVEVRRGVGGGKKGHKRQLER